MTRFETEAKGNSEVPRRFNSESASEKTRGVLPKILGGGVPHGSQNPDPISD